MITRIAQLDRKISIMQPAFTVSDSGQRKRTWQVWRQCFAKVTERYGNEGLENNAVVATTTTEFIVRYKTGLNHEMVIEYRGNQYNIEAITEAQHKGQFYRDRFTKIVATLKDQTTTHQF